MKWKTSWKSAGALFIASTLVLSSCASAPNWLGGFGGGAQSARLASSGDAWLTARASLAPACVIDDYGKDDGSGFFSLAMLGPVVLPSLIEAGLNLISSGIRNVAQSARTNVVARANGHFLRGDTNTGLYRVHENLGCLVFAYGRVTSTGTAATTLTGEWAENADAFNARGLNFAEEPLFYFEGIVKFSDDQTGTFTINTAYVHMSDELRRSRFFGGDEDVLLTFTFQRHEGQVISVGAIPFANLSHEITLSGAESLSSYATSWMMLPQPAQQDQVRLAQFCGRFGCPPETAETAAAADVEAADVAAAETGAGEEEGAAAVTLPVCGEPDAVCAQPYTLVVEFSRSSNVSAALIELADQFDYARPAITPHLTAELTEEATERLNLRAPDPQNTIRLAAAHTACEALVTSRQAYEAADATQRTAMSADVRTKINAAEAAYSAAGLPWWNVVADSAIGCMITR